MIPISEAFNRVMENAPQLPTQEVELSQAYRRFLAEDVVSPDDHPFFDQSSMDGYALVCEPSRKSWKIVGEVAAGQHFGSPLKAGEAVRIFTGAPIPEGANTVLIQEHSKREGDTLYNTQADPSEGANIRYRGEQIRSGAVALKAGSLIDSAAIGYLASLGIRKVRVHKTPEVGIIVTGSEFAKGDEEAGKGLIYDSNGIMLQKAMECLGIEADFATCEDEKERLKARIAHLSQENDLIILTGGVSVGDYDHTPWALEANGFEILFHKVAQKPGKPMLMARKGNKIAFGLPGNPRAVYMSFWYYVKPFLARVMGGGKERLEMFLPLRQDHSKRSGRAELLAARYHEGGVEMLSLQGSHMLQSITEADCVIELPAEAVTLRSGDIVKVIPIHDKLR